MATKEIVWDRLTPVEARTLAGLIERGEKVYAAPIEISNDYKERQKQFNEMHITLADCRNWDIGCHKVLVHLTPSNEATYNYEMKKLRKKHKEAFRKGRCPIPGRQKILISCPDSNSCYNCPHPEYRDMHLSLELSWDGLVEEGFEVSCDDGTVEQVEVVEELNDVSKVIAAHDPKFLRASTLRFYYGYPVSEIAKMMDDTERNIYYYLEQAKRIGKQYRKEKKIK